MKVGGWTFPDQAKVGGPGWFQAGGWRRLVFGCGSGEREVRER